MTTTVMYYNGRLADVSDEEAEALYLGGQVRIIGHVESAMVAAPENAMLPAARPSIVGRKKPRKGMKRGHDE